MNTLVLVAKMCKDLVLNSFAPYGKTVKAMQLPVFCFGRKKAIKVVKLHRFARAVNVSKELLLLTFALGCKIDQRLKNEQIYYVGHFTIITHIYFDLSVCRKVDQCFTITHLLMFQKLFSLRLLLMFSTARLRMQNRSFA